MILAPEDAAALIRQTRTENIVLVGGQAVVTWADYFGISSGVRGLTTDVDYLGTRREAQLADARLQLPHKLKLGAPEDLPNTALISVSLRGYDEPVLIDYLAMLEGLDSREISKSAVTLRLNGEALKIIHPILLLQSKIWNLYSLKHKRTPAGIEQARLAIRIVAAYFANVEMTQRERLKAVEKVARFAATKTAKDVRGRHGLDVLAAIPMPTLAGLPAAFRDKRWPQITAAAK